MNIIKDNTSSGQSRERLRPTIPHTILFVISWFYNNLIITLIKTIKIAIKDAEGKKRNERRSMP